MVNTALRQGFKAEGGRGGAGRPLNGGRRPDITAIVTAAWPVPAIAKTGDKKPPLDDASVGATIVAKAVAKGRPSTWIGPPGELSPHAKCGAPCFRRPASSTILARA